MNLTATSHDSMLLALDRLRGTAVEFGGFLANHGPMAADAMIRLGGHDQVARWVDRYRIGLEPAPAGGGAVTAANWQQQLGRYERVTDWVSFFRREIADSGWRRVLATWWPRLLPGSAASATHGLLRTAHAVRNLAGNDIEPLLVDELSAGLAFWAARFQRLPGAPRLAGRLDLDRALARLPRLDGGVHSSSPGIAGRLESLFQLDELPAAMDALGVAGDPTAGVDELIGHAARVVLARPDAPIAYCHAVTAPAAVRMILPELPVELYRPTLAVCWQLVASIVAAFARPPDPIPECVDDDEVPTVRQLAAAAIAHGDEHVLKLTEACLRQFDLTGDRLLLVAADRFRHRIQPRW